MAAAAVEGKRGAETFQRKDAEVRRQRLDQPFHQPRESLFSQPSDNNDCAGWVNWAFLMLALGGISLLLESLANYGLRIDIQQWVAFFSGRQEGTDEHPLFVLLSFGASAATTIYVVLFLKLWSYVQVNRWCRNGWTCGRYRVSRQNLSLQKFVSVATKDNTIQHQEENPESEVVLYPDNLNVTNIFYYIFAPTLCYELNFPRAPKIRKRFLIRRLLEVVVGCQLLLLLSQQWIIPFARCSLLPFSKVDTIKIMELVLKLAVPNQLFWLIGFYVLFHSFFNLMGELLCFADRHFYDDWWNASNMYQFWKKWNLPVHYWCTRHVYLPLIEMGYSSTFARVAVFFVSGVLHEFVLGVTLQVFASWAFITMMAQEPLSVITFAAEKKLGAKWGNIIGWLAFVLGPTLAIVLYYHDYVVKHYGEELLEVYGQA